MVADLPLPVLIALLAGTGFLLGSFPTAYLLVRTVLAQDIRRLGSGNVGATNARRALGWGGFAAVFLVDAAKGAAPVAAGIALGLPPGTAAWAGAAAVAGHCYTPWLGWRGGKGVATAAGAFGVVAPAVVAAALLVWAGVVAATRRSSLGSLLGLVAAILGVVRWGPAGAGEALLLTAAIIIWRHRDNLRRLITGTEREMSG